MKQMLSYAAHLPTVHFAAGEIIVREGESSGPLWVLESGTLEIRKGNVVVNIVTRAGALIGEISLLLGVACSATVEAVTPCVLRCALDGRALLASNPQVLALVAVELAERLHCMTTYFADLKHQYADIPGLNMVPDVLGQIAERPLAPLKAGSARDPDPDY